MSRGSRNHVSFWEEFNVLTDDGGEAISDATPPRLNDILIIPISGNVQMTATVDEPNGVMSFSGAGGAGDGVVFVGTPFQPSTCGNGWVEARFKSGTVTTMQMFLGFQETVDYDETVNPFTLSGTTLTANNVGQVAGIYFDTTATTDDWRFMAASDGTAATTATTRQGTSLGSLGIRLRATPAADSYMTARVELQDDGSVDVYYGDVSTDPANTGMKLVASLKAGALDRTAMYHPILQLIDPSTNDPLWEVDYFGGGYNRDWTY